MKKLKRLERAINLAVEAHAGQFDKAGFPYVLHPIRVAAACKSEDAKIVAVLHDVVEDTDFTSIGIHEQFGPVIGAGVDAMTKDLQKRRGRYESYREYLDRVDDNPLAREVKLADMADNSRPERIQYLSIEKQVRLIAKYTRGRHYLMTGEWYENSSLDQVIKDGFKK